MTVMFIFEKGNGYASLMMVEGERIKLFHTSGGGIETHKDHQQFMSIARRSLERDARDEGFSETAIVTCMSAQPESKTRGRA